MQKAKFFHLADIRSQPYLSNQKNVEGKENPLGLERFQSDVRFSIQVLVIIVYLKRADAKSV